MRPRRALLLGLLLLVLAVRPFSWVADPAATRVCAAEIFLTRRLFGTLFTIAPDGLAVLEHLTDLERLATSRCRIDNLQALGGPASS